MSERPDVGDREIWLHPGVGVAGDMLLGALLDLGADEAFVRAQLDTLELPGWSMRVTATRRRGLVATAVDVEVPDDDVHRPWSLLDELLRGAELHPSVAEGARATFRRLAEAEAAVHGIAVDEVHFHEVGALDAVVDIVGAWAALVALAGGHDATAASVSSLSVASGPVGLGTGVAEMAHGVVPVPAPAVLELLRGLPVVPVVAAIETATPTGAALLVSMARRWGALPAGTVVRSARGAGSRDPERHANVLTAVLVDTSVRVDMSRPGDEERVEPGGGASSVPAVLLETNVDDVSPETVAYVVDRALAAGADDVWATPIVMKKGRPAQQLSVLCRPELAERMRTLLVVETGSLGVRQRMLDKFELDRHEDVVVVDGHRIGIKVGPHGAKPEHDDVSVAARALDRPLRDVAHAAMAAWATHR